MTLSAGTRLGPYEIVGPIGAGGMGEVYRARDVKLGRDVALKVLPAALAEDTDYMGWFRREAQVLASLNHPNIAHIYGLEENAMVMELVEGSEPRGPMPLQDVLKIARQVADALEAAHDRGIVHRDLKPSNIKVTPAGIVKVLDFGLATAIEPAGGPTTAESPTVTIRTSEAGTIMGTAAYISPERARGKPVDKRTDIWAFGVVLWELLTGRAMFEGETVSDVLAEVLKKQPDLALVPAEVRRGLDACLQKDPQRRLRDIGDFWLLLGEARTIDRKRSWLPWVIAAAGAIAGGLGWWLRTPSAPLRPLMRLYEEMPREMSIARGSAGGVVALSPDGSRLAVTLREADGRIRLYTRLLQQNQLTPLMGTDDASSPFFSPDGEWLGFVARGKVKKIPVEGGTPVTLCDAPNARGASWGDDGNIVLALDAATGLSRIPSNGGTPAPLTKLNPGEATHRWPQVLPGSHAVLFTSHNSGFSFDEANIEVFAPETGERRILQRGGHSGRYVAAPRGPGYLVYLHQNTLFAIPFDANRLTLTGAATPILDDVGSALVGGGDFTFSRNGTLAYLPGTGVMGIWTISWLDNSGRTQPLQATAGSYWTPRLSPNGKRLAFALASGSRSDIWVRDLDRETPSRLTFLNGINRWPVWTPDEKGLVFRSEDPQAPGLYWINADGSGDAQRLTDGKANQTPSSISPDGRRLAFQQAGNAGSFDIFTTSIEGDPAHLKLGQPELFLGTPFEEVHPTFSPDGHWLAYGSNESGTTEVYVRPFPGPGARWQISTGGGDFPRWSRDGRELLFESLDRRIMAVSLTVKGGSFTAGKPRLWSETRLRDLGGVMFSNFDLAPDGKRIAAILDDENQKPVPYVTFLLNFADELQRRVPRRSQ